MKRLTLFLLSLTFASQGWGQVQMDRINSAGVNGVLNASRYAGGSDIGVGINNAFAALPTQTIGANSYHVGTILVPAGTYTVSTKVSITSPFVILWMYGATLNCAVSGDCLYFQDTPFESTPPGPQAGGVFGGQILGNGSASQVGLHAVDMTNESGFALRDTDIQNFTGTGAVGFWADNANDWSEREYLENAAFKNNTVSIKGSVEGTGTNSWGHNNWNLRMSVGNGQVGIQLNNNILIYASTISGVVNYCDHSTMFQLNGTSGIDSTNFIAFHGDASTCSQTGVSMVTSAVGTSFTPSGQLDGWPNSTIFANCSGTCALRGGLAATNSGNQTPNQIGVFPGSAGGSWFWLDNASNSPIDALRISSGTVPGTNPIYIDANGGITHNVTILPGQSFPLTAPAAGTGKVGYDTSGFTGGGAANNDLRCQNNSGRCNIVFDNLISTAGAQLWLNNPLTITAAPTIASGFGTSPSILSYNGSATFRVNVGTGGTANSGVIGLPTATTGWNCLFSDMSTHSNFPQQTASTTTTVTVGGFNSAGAATAWAASDTLIAHCEAY